MVVGRARGRASRQTAQLDEHDLRFEQPRQDCLVVAISEGDSFFHGRWLSITRPTSAWRRRGARAGAESKRVENPVSVMQMALGWLMAGLACIGLFQGNRLWSSVHGDAGCDWRDDEMDEEKGSECRRRVSPLGNCGSGARVGMEGGSLIWSMGEETW
ncbi:hypothetical protein IWX90DRAFT_134308 [Phyllosticta citrichinensis]|uniref:Uncharacterized protein n=1 Tax=Phyllosticta citrichinensis TaxID=1130410 RepID=A0ABR1XET7_9PEZI